MSNLGLTERGRGYRTRSGAAVTLALATLLVGCRTPVASSDLSAFGKAAAGISQQASTAFTESNKLARSVSAEHFIASGQVGLSESQFQLAVAPSDIAAWQVALTRLEEYSDALASLADDKRAPAMSDALLKVGKNLNNSAIGVSVSPLVGAGFASLGGAILAGVQDHEVRKILARTDPAVQQITSEMASAIGLSDAEGLRGTVKSNWTTSLNGVRADYPAAATNHDLAKQRALVDQYLAALDKRDAQLKTLADLRQSIVALGAAHAAAAAGKPASAQALLSIVVARAEETKRLYDAFTAK